MSDMTELAKAFIDCDEYEHESGDEYLARIKRIAENSGCDPLYLLSAVNNIEREAEQKRWLQRGIEFGREDAQAEITVALELLCEPATSRAN